MYTQGQAVLNRSFFPCFDTPSVKCTYSAVVKVSGGPGSTWGCGPIHPINANGSKTFPEFAVCLRGSCRLPCGMCHNTGVSHQRHRPGLCSAGALELMLIAITSNPQQRST